MENNFKASGKLHKIFATESKSDTFQKREFVITTEGQYPQFIKFQLLQDRCQLIDPYSEGDKVEVHFDIRGNEWNGKFFTNLNVWRIENTSSHVEEEGDEQAKQQEGTMEFETMSDELKAEDFDDLPF